MPVLTPHYESLKCPHCLQLFTASLKGADLGTDNISAWSIRYQNCPGCHEFIFFLDRAVPTGHGDREIIRIMVWPRTTARPLPTEVPPNFANDFREACSVLADSPKASAALSRRCLQMLLREEAHVKPSDLGKEIQQVLESKSLPSSLTDAIDSVRALGNFAAHPMKSTNTGEIIDVEPGEAEWLLDTLEGLFDFYFVQPGRLKQKRDALNTKLSNVGKPPIK